MKINWKVRLKQKQFLVAIFSSILLAIQAVANLLGYSISDALGEQLTYTFNTVLSVFVVAGIVVDPTTKNVSDSDSALKYDEPK